MQRTIHRSVLKVSVLLGDQTCRLEKLTATSRDDSKWDVGGKGRMQRLRRSRYKDRSILPLWTLQSYQAVLSDNDMACPHAVGYLGLTIVPHIDAMSCRINRLVGSDDKASTCTRVFPVCQFLRCGA